MNNAVQVDMEESEDVSTVAGRTVKRSQYLIFQDKQQPRSLLTFTGKNWIRYS